MSLQDLYSNLNHFKLSLYVCFRVVVVHLPPVAQVLAANLPQVKTPAALEVQNLWSQVSSVRLKQSQ